MTSIILLLFLTAFGFLSVRLAARLHFHWGGDAMEAGDHQEAVRHYEKAAGMLPKDGGMWKALGGALHALSREKPVHQAYELEQRAKEAFERATGLIPIDAEAHYGLARSTARLERMHYLIHPGPHENPHHPLPHFRKAIDLRPNGILYRYALARYLYRISDIRAFRDTIKDLVRIYPPTYTRLKREPFWSRPLEAVVIQGLHQAIDSGTMPAEAHTALADIMERNLKPLEAVRHYTLALEENPSKAGPAHHIRLGRLFLKAGDRVQAEDSFMQALRASTSRERHLRRILSAYKNHLHIHAFVDFFDRADRSIPFSPEAGLVKAAALIEIKAYTEARYLLERLNRQRPTADAHYLLYKIAAHQGDQDRMELAIQKATVLEPDNSRFHYLFSRVLLDAGKIEAAEHAATRAIERSDKPNHRLFHYRAKLRTRMNDHSGALSDWETGITLADKAMYHAHAAEALLNLGRFDEALEHAAKAAALEPENPRYEKRHMELREKLKDT